MKFTRLESWLSGRARRFRAGVCVALGAGWLAAGFELGNGPAAAVEPVGTPAKTLVILGDSLGAGLGVEPDQAWPALLQSNLVQARLPYVVVNASVSGDTTAGGVRRLEWQLKRPIDVLLIELGGNDGLRGLPPGATRSNLVTLITRTRTRYPRAGILFTDMKMPASMGPEYAAKFDAVFPEVAAETQATLISGFLGGVWGVPELNQADQIHPTPAGHALVASNVWRVLEPILRRP